MAAVVGTIGEGAESAYDMGVPSIFSIILNINKNLF
ncbi:glycerate kinase [Tyzzerella sp. An114]|nr:glycerate kinase [Tyzzerella sp. An114]